MVVPHLSFNHFRLSVFRYFFFFSLVKKTNKKQTKQKKQWPTRNRKLCRRRRIKWGVIENRKCFILFWGRYFIVCFCYGTTSTWPAAKGISFLVYIRRGSFAWWSASRRSFFYRLAQYTAVCGCIETECRTGGPSTGCETFSPIFDNIGRSFLFRSPIGDRETKEWRLTFPFDFSRWWWSDWNQMTIKTKALSTKISVSEEDLLCLPHSFFFSLVSHKNINKDPSAARQQPKCHKYSRISDSPAVITSASTSYPASEKGKRRRFLFCFFSSYKGLLFKCCSVGGTRDGINQKRE